MNAGSIEVPPVTADGTSVWTLPLEPRDVVAARDVTQLALRPDGAEVAIVLREGTTGRSSLRLVQVVDRASRIDRGVRPSVAPTASPAWDRRGVRLALAERSEGQPTLTIVDASTGAAQPVPLPPGLKQVRAVHWTVDDQLACHVDLTGDIERRGLWLLDAADGHVLATTPVDLMVENIAVFPDRPHVVLVVSDASTKPGAGSECRLVVFDLTAGRVLRTLTDRARAPASREQILEVSPSGSRVLFSWRADGGPYWPAIIGSGGGPVEHLLSDHEGTVMRAVWAGDDDHVIAQVFEGTRSVVRRLGVDGSDMRVVVEFLSRYPSIDVDRSGECVAFVARSPDSPGDVWAYRTGAATLRLTDLHTRLRERRSAIVQEVTWRGSDDSTTMYGVLLRPPTHLALRPWATVVLLHGGPHFHWDAGWHESDWAHVLTERGYAVFLPNPRGSTGRTWSFAHAIRGQIGVLPLQDVLDGVDMLVEEGFADADRLAVGGWSYGGFLTAWTITQTDRFRAAVVGAGISDFYSFIGSSPMGRAWREFFPAGNYPDRGAFDAASPMTHLRQARTPTLVVHGDQDPKVPIDQGRMLHQGLADMGVETEFLELAGGAHRVEDPDHQEAILRSVVDWFTRHLDPAPRPRHH